MQHIIMCGGRYDAWQTPRQLTEICGEPIVARTIRLLTEYGADDIAISTHDERFAEFGVPILRHDNPFVGYGVGGTWVDAFYPTAKPACYIMGDVVFSPEAIKTIVETETDDIMLFASAPPFSEVYPKPWAEPFAFKVNDQIHFRESINFVRANENTGIFRRRPIAWELWQVVNGENPRTINYGNYTAINDYTCDIDEPADIERIEGAMRTWQTFGR